MVYAIAYVTQCAVSCVGGSVHMAACVTQCVCGVYGPHFCRFGWHFVYGGSRGNGGDH